ncbi:MAG: signal recognition particle-docking protein FtsY [Pseudomonadota bacterium]
MQEEDADISANQKSEGKFRKFFSRNRNESKDASEIVSNDSLETDTETTIDDGLSKSRSGFLGKISHAFKGSFDLSDSLFEELEDALISSDVGIDASLDLIERLRARVSKNKTQDAEGVLKDLMQVVADTMQPAEQAWEMSKHPYVLVMVGVNGVGKTTTTAKIAHQLHSQGKKVMLAAGDTFRAAAVEQLQRWGDDLDIPVVAQGHGADAAAVAHDALTSAISKEVDVLIIDTAGRLHTQNDLMEQLQKVLRVLQKIDPNAPHEVMQILDATTGQNAITQLDAFQKAVGVSSICLTKLDGSAKGGVAIGLTERFKLPIRYIGIGERVSDLKPFDARAFGQALIPTMQELQALD